VAESEPEWGAWMEKDEWGESSKACGHVITKLTELFGPLNICRCDFESMTVTSTAEWRRGRRQ
jgi:hypothetical protein